MYIGWTWIRIGDCLATLVCDCSQLAIIVWAVFAYQQSLDSMGIIPSLVSLCFTIVLATVQVVSEYFDKSREKSSSGKANFNFHIDWVGNSPWSAVPKGAAASLYNRNWAEWIVHYSIGVCVWVYCMSNALRIFG